MCSDSPREGGGDPAVVQVEAGVADLGAGVVHRRLGRTLLGCALLDVLNRTGVGALKRLRPFQFVVGQLQPGCRRLDLCARLTQPDLVGNRIDQEQQLALAHDVAVSEVDLGQHPAHLSAQFHLIERRKLTHEADLGCQIALQRCADPDLRRWRCGADGGRMREHGRH